jgi:hypothetical protein
MNATIYERLKEAAKEKRFLTYSDVSAAIGLSLTDAEGLNKLSVLLEEIADHEIDAGRPLLVAIIVSDSNNMPGSGLFSYAKRKGLMSAKDKDKLTFFLAEAKKVHEFWAAN